MASTEFAMRVNVSGYAHATYAQSLAKFGEPRYLPRSEGWILERQIPGYSYYDAMGCYPLFSCRNWSQLCADLEDIGDSLVSLAVVPDPFDNYDAALLRQNFQDVVIPFKPHYVADLSQPLASFVSPHHCRNAQKALKTIDIEQCADPNQFIDDWLRLYKFLVQRHNIRGIPAFSDTALTQQLQVPGLVMFRAVWQGQTIGILLWYIKNEVGYYHLAAFNPAGYRLWASFGLFWYAFEYFADNNLKWLNLGGGAGIKNNTENGLGRFKAGWSTGVRTVYFCGRIFNKKVYTEIVRAKNLEQNHYFPAYRYGEFK